MDKLNKSNKNKVKGTDASCLFCKICSGQIPSSKFWENDDFIAILDLFPNTKGASLVISKKHVGSDIFKLKLKTDFDVVHAALDAAKQAANMLQKTLKPSRVALVSEGVFIDHLHLKLYPLYGVSELIDGKGSKISGEEQVGVDGKKRKNVGIAKNAVFFEKFPGYVTTQGGPEWNRGELDGLVDKIYRSNGTQ